MAASQDADGEDSTDIENAADANGDEDGGFDVKALLDAQFEAIEEDGEQIVELVKAAHFRLGVDGDTSEEVQGALRALMQEIMSEHDEVSTAEVVDAMWSELLYISSKLQEDPEENEAAGDREADADADGEGDGDEQASLDDIAAMATGDDEGDGEVGESGASHDPAFQ
ncbi:hypothetical protein [Halorubellus litoreus]|uniref:Uncharacterized protein n=1 Tax=Halorubellus litoreus TaxID=755308 RepID=A0ABD5VJD4_9EURY